MIVVLAEKPSVARDIAAVVGASERRAGFYRGPTHVVTWALGHLVGLAQPEAINEAWGGPWRADTLPMLPAAFRLEVLESTRQQFDVVRKLLCDRSTKRIVCATDAGREGELIFRYVYERAGCTKPVDRLWISSLTPSAIRAGFAALRPSADYDALASAARARAVADWLVGMNLSRAYTLASGELSTVGRVQTPTLALIVARDVAIAKHVPTHFRKVEVRLQADGGSFDAQYVRLVPDATTGLPKDSATLPPRGETALSATEDADAIAARARVARATVVAVERTESAASPPQLFDLAELQRTAIRLWGWTASEVLGVAQELYETHKVLSYPRTDSRYVSKDVALTLPGIVEAVRAPYQDQLAEGTGSRALGKRFVDDTKVTDHHAIIPTGTAPRALVAGTRAHQLYDLVCRRLLQAWQPDLIEAVTEVRVALATSGIRDRYHARGKTVVRAGWRALELVASAREPEALLPARMVAGTPLQVCDVRIKNEQTQPRPRHTEATLLKAMELAGQALPEELAEAMKSRGLGTPATRAATIESLVARGYMVREGKSLCATPRGAALVAKVHPHVCSPAMTGEWEERLRRLEQGNGSYHEFVDAVSRFVSQTVTAALANGVAPPKPRAHTAGGTTGAGARRKRTSRTSGRTPREAVRR